MTGLSPRTEHRVAAMLICWPSTGLGRRGFRLDPFAFAADAASYSSSIHRVADAKVESGEEDE